jgi:spermidine synthase
MVSAFVAALFTSAALLFCVQPMVAKMLLPLLGGAPAVWNTSMVFFQGALLLGYLYAHASLRVLGVRRQAVVHCLLLLVPLLVLPIAVAPDAARGWDAQASPILPLLALLAKTVGLPFFVLAASAPLLQRWFSSAGHPAGKDPYFLYAASNLGSMLALGAYPVVMEPWLALRAQSALWRGGFVVLVGLVAACAALTLRAKPSVAGASPSSAGADVEPGAEDAAPITAPITGARRARWIVLSFVPSSLLLGLTTYVSTDVASVPLFWVAPLALYLATFILVFARKPPIRHDLMVRWTPLVVTATAAITLSEVGRPPWAIVLLHVLAFFVCALACHGELARDRPNARHLTEYYLVMSAGGVLGGLFNGLVAPLVFNQLVEYPLALIAACLCMPRPQGVPRFTRADVVAPLVLAAVATLVITLGYGKMPYAATFALALGLPLLVNYTWAKHRLRFALGLAVAFVAGAFHTTTGRTLYAERSFFGVLRVTRDLSGRFDQIVHGRIVHGRQHVDPAKRRSCTAYYHRTGPLGDVFASQYDRSGRARIGVAGLGAGGMACYARPGDAWTYFEIDPLVVRVAQSGKHFSYLADAFGPGGAELRVDVGDARLRLAQTPAASFDLLAIDVFSSDAIPLHLVTREALAVYLERLAPGGLLVWHISNQYLDLAPPLAKLAEGEGLELWGRYDFDVSDADADDGKTRSVWVVMSRDADRLRALVSKPAWERLKSRPGDAPWTDEYTNLIKVLKL